MRSGSTPGPGARREVGRVLVARLGRPERDPAKGRSGDGVIEIAGPALAAILTPMGLIDEDQIYLHPVALGDGTPFLKAARPPLRRVGNEPIGESVIRLTYVPF